MGNAYRSVLALKPTGDAIPANVLAGKTFSNADGVGKTGTMVNNGAVSVTLTDQVPTYTIPEGYHNGSGVVGFSASGGDGADLIVICSSVFAGATISCTDGTTTFQQICPSTTPFEVVFESIPVGMWTISGTAEGMLYSTQFTVVDFETVLNSTPEGSTVIPTDDVQTWLHCANIWDKAYTTISQVLADASTLQALIASNNAADYMARSSTWASTVCSDSSTMTIIGSNSYCSEVLLSDSTWLSSICNSAYFENVLDVKVPTMTSDTSPSGEVVYSSQTGTYNAYKAFDKNNSSYWHSAENAFPQTLGYKFGQNVRINKVVFRNRYEGSATSVNCPTNFTVQGYDGTNWNDITGNLTPQTAATSGVNTYIINNLNGYLGYRLRMTSSTGSALALTELQFYGRAVA